MPRREIEIEIQVNVERIQPLVDFLQQRGVYKGEECQKDEYFSPAHRDFLSTRPVLEWLRLRETEGRFSLDYKHWYVDERGKSNYCDEYTTTIAEPAAFRKILTALNFHSIGTVDKIRKTWLYDKYIIALDTVKNLGDFVEVEYNGDDAAVVNPKEVTDAMTQFLKDHGCGTIKRNYKGYPFLILFPGEREYEVV